MILLWFHFFSIKIQLKYDIYAFSESSLLAVIYVCVCVTVRVSDCQPIGSWGNKMLELNADLPDAYFLFTLKYVCIDFCKAYNAQTHDRRDNAPDTVYGK